MRIDLFPFELPIRTYSYRQTTLSKRQGIFLRLELEGAFYYGEIIPFPKLSPYSLKDCIDNITRNQFAFNNTQKWDWEKDLFGILKSAFPLITPVQFALEQCLFFYALHQLKLFSLQSSPIPINRLAFPGEQAIFFARDTIKIKIGRDFSKEWPWIHQLLQVHPHIRLRLDANLQLTPADEAIFALWPEDLRNRVEYLEDPCLISKESPWTLWPALASDEMPLSSLASPPKALILRPGQRDTISSLVRLKRQNPPFQMVISSSFESDYSINFFLALIEFLQLESTPHGLDTFRFLAQYLLDTPLKLQQIGDISHYCYQQQWSLHVERLHSLAL